jgi:hypothetical protein
LHEACLAFENIRVVHFCAYVGKPDETRKNTGHILYRNVPSQTR